MKVNLKNLAHIKSAEFEDEQLVIILGDNGSGKTLMLETISLLKNYYSDRLDKYAAEMKEKFGESINLNFKWEDLKLNKILKSIGEVMNEDRKFFTRPIKGLTFGVSVSKPQNLTSELKTILDSEKENAIDKVNNDILLETKQEKGDFSFSLQDTPRFFENANVKLNILINATGKLMIILFDETGNTVRSTISLFDKRSNLFDEGDLYLIQEEELDSFFVPEQELQEMIQVEIKKLFIKLKLVSYFGPKNILYLPSERNLLMDNVFKNAAEATELNSIEYKQRYSEKLFNYEYLRYKHISGQISGILDKRRYSTALDPLFGGKIVYGDDGEVSKIEKEDGAKIKRELFSTKQNRLIPFLMIETRLPPSYDYIIIEEPEAHLSLKSMKELVNYLTSLLNDKKKNLQKEIILSTHSDVFFAFLNNKIIDNQLEANVYEMKICEDETSILEKKERSEYGFQVDLFTDLLKELYDETFLIQQKEKEDE
ncbi:AAA family ATPase [Virgibacillus sp. Bac330]|uniref:AAA family ATPase n=1 Tax=Virgibacillus sp. Bac330 TaxID=2419841 RepID=UPI000EF4BC2E|nr:AAA family ATPase [Virgibacillus sp. Bac330]